MDTRICPAPIERVPGTATRRTIAHRGPLGAPTVVAPDMRIIATDIGYQRPARNDGEGVR